jgi:hypothetical protein
MKPKHKLPPWLKPMTRSAGVAFGVGWYTEENWQKVKAAAADPDRFEDTYAEWVEMGEMSLRNLRATGINAEKTFVVAEELLAWCLAHNKSNNGAARAEFVSQLGGNAR